MGVGFLIAYQAKERGQTNLFYQSEKTYLLIIYSIKKWPFYIQIFQYWNEINLMEFGFFFRLTYNGSSLRVSLGTKAPELLNRLIVIEDRKTYSDCQEYPNYVWSVVVHCGVSCVEQGYKLIKMFDITVNEMRGFRLLIGMVSRLGCSGISVKPP